MNTLKINDVIRGSLRNGCDYFNNLELFDSKVESDVLHNMYFVVSSVNPYNNRRYYSVMGYCKKTHRIFRVFDRSFCTLKGSKVALKKMMEGWK